MARTAKEERHINPELMRITILYALHELEQLQEIRSDSDLKKRKVDVPDYRLKFLEDILAAERAYSKNWVEDLTQQVELRDAIKKPLISIYEAVRDQAGYAEKHQFKDIFNLILPWCTSEAEAKDKAQELLLERHEVAGTGPAKWSAEKLREVFRLADDRTLDKFIPLYGKRSADFSLKEVRNILSFFFSEEAVSRALDILEQDRLAVKSVETSDRV